MRTVALPRGRQVAAPAQRVRMHRRDPFRLLRRVPLHLAILAICLLWLAPTVGLLISSFRPPDLVATTGWWEALTPPFDFTLNTTTGC